MALTIAGQDLGINMPSFTGGGFGSWLTIIAVILLVVGFSAVAFWFWYQGKIFNKRIKVFENIAGAGWQHTGNDKARIVKVGDGGEEIMYLQKRRVYRTAYGRKMGKNTYWFAIGQDGYWYNVVLGDLDAKMGMLDIEPIDRDMRYMHVAIRKNIQERYRKIGFMEKYGQILMSGIFFIILIIGIWLLISKVEDLITIAGQNIEAGKPVADALSNAVGNLDNLCSGGSGIKSAS
jgi:hypothetical protein|tara:strand:+ start:10463 stop:11164 length:702 start_codon:yes stop_codon:yes gene_type:complete